jgi:hypothetical protein
MGRLYTNPRLETGASTSRRLAHLARRIEAIVSSIGIAAIVTGAAVYRFRPRYLAIRSNTPAGWEDI